MRRTIAALILIAGCLGPGVASADEAAMKPVKHRHHVVARFCATDTRPYSEGEFCTVSCRGPICITQTCHGGNWYIQPATCPPGACPAFC